MVSAVLYYRVCFFTCTIILFIETVNNYTIYLAGFLKSKLCIPSPNEELVANVVRLSKYRPPYIAEPTNEIMTIHCQPRPCLQVHHCLHV